MFLVVGIFACLFLINIVTRIKYKMDDKKAIEYFRPPAGVIGAEDKEINMLGAQREKIFEASFMKKSHSVWRDNERFLECVNQWLANNPNICKVRFRVETKKIRGIDTKKEKIEKIILQYDLDEKNNKYQYAFVEVLKHSHSRHIPDAKECINKWIRNNPNAEIVQTNAGTIHTTVNSSFQHGDSYAHTMQVLMLVAVDRKNIEYDVPYEQKYIDRKRRKTILCATVLASLLVIIAAGNIYLNTQPRIVGKVTYEGLQLSVNQRIPKLIKVNYTNEGNDWSLGWANNPKVTAKTDVGTYYSRIHRINKRILAGKSGGFLVFYPDLEGNLESLTFEQVLLLDERGMPEKENIITIPVIVEQSALNIKSELEDIVQTDDSLAKKINSIVSPKETILLEVVPEDLKKYYEIQVEKTSESSSINEKFNAYAAIDGDSTTSWQEGIKGNDGIGEWLELVFDRTYAVKYMMLQLGNWKSQDSFEQNNRPENITLCLEDKALQFQFTDEKKEFWIEMSEPINTKQVKVIIDSVFTGSKYRDTCITEIKLYGN